MERLQLSARRLIWLNPLLRWDGFTPRARGVRAILPHVDSFRACHNLASLEERWPALSRPDDAGEKRRPAAPARSGMTGPNVSGAAEGSCPQGSARTPATKPPTLSAGGEQPARGVEARRVERRQRLLERGFGGQRRRVGDGAGAAAAPRPRPSCRTPSPAARDPRPRQRGPRPVAGGPGVGLAAASVSPRAARVVSAWSKAPASAKERARRVAASGPSSRAERGAGGLRPPEAELACARRPAARPALAGGGRRARRARARASGRPSSTSRAAMVDAARVVRGGAADEVGGGRGRSRRRRPHRPRRDRPRRAASTRERREAVGRRRAGRASAARASRDRRRQFGAAGERRGEELRAAPARGPCRGTAAPRPGGR